MKTLEARTKLQFNELITLFGEWDEENPKESRLNHAIFFNSHQWTYREVMTLVIRKSHPNGTVELNAILEWASEEGVNVDSLEQTIKED